MANSGGTGLSFSFSKTSKKSSVVSSAVRIDDASSRRQGNSGGDEDGVVTDVGNADLKEIGRQIEGPKEYVIPLIKSSKRKAADDDKKDAKKERRDMTELEKEAVAELAQDAEEAAQREPEEERSVPLLMQNRLDKTDDDTLAEVSNIDDYEDMPVQHFGTAMLRGMGWKPGAGVGRTNKKEVKPVEFIHRSGGRGLGADAGGVVEQLTGKPKSRRLKPGEVRKTEKQLPVGADGRVRHTRNVGEALDDREDLEMRVGSRGLVEGGRHRGLYGTVVSMQMDPPRVVVRLAISDQLVDVSQSSVVTVPRRQYEQRALTVDDNDDDGDRNGDKAGGSSSHRRSPSSLHSRDGQHGAKSSRRERSPAPDSPQDRSSSSKSDRKKKKKKRKKHHYRSDSSAEETGNGASGRHERPWLASQLRVRMVDQKYRKGLYYNCKIIVEDVITPTVCECRTDSGVILDSVEQGMLETVVPREHKAPVMVVGGAHRRSLGRMLSRDRDACRAVVQLYPEFETVECSFDEVCEYVGRTEHL